jgi:hypothetical protein
MNRWTIRVGLSLMIALGWWAQRLPAQTPVIRAQAGPAVVQPAPVEVGVPVESSVSAHGPIVTRLLAPINHLGDAGTAVAKRFGMCCKSTIDHPGCGSAREHLVFTFGSCHAWFGEGCEASPFHSWTPPRAIPEEYKQTGAK